MCNSQRRNRLGVAQVCALLIALSLAGCSGGSLSPDVQGRWASTDPGYVDHSFTLSPEVFVLDLGEHGKERYAVQAIHREQTRDGRIYYEVKYKNQHKQKETFAFFHETNRDAITIRNRPEVVWSKTEAKR